MIKVAYKLQNLKNEVDNQFQYQETLFKITDKYVKSFKKENLTIMLFSNNFYYNTQYKLSIIVCCLFINLI